MRKSVLVLFILFSILVSGFVEAWRWCCSWHWWQAYCSSNWRWICADGTASPSCLCRWSSIYWYQLAPEKCPTWHMKNSNWKCVTYNEWCKEQFWIHSNYLWNMICWCENWYVLSEIWKWCITLTEWCIEQVWEHAIWTWNYQCWCESWYTTSQVEKKCITLDEWCVEQFWPHHVSAWGLSCKCEYLYRYDEQTKSCIDLDSYCKKTQWIHSEGTQFDNCNCTVWYVLYQWKCITVDEISDSVDKAIIQHNLEERAKLEETVNSLESALSFLEENPDYYTNLIKEDEKCKDKFGKLSFYDSSINSCSCDSNSQLKNNKCVCDFGYIDQWNSYCSSCYSILWVYAEMKPDWTCWCVTWTFLSNEWRCTKKTNKYVSYLRFSIFMIIIVGIYVYNKKKRK